MTTCNHISSKICTSCKIEKPADFNHFGMIRKGEEILLRGVCKECRKIESKKYYENNKDKVKEYWKNNRDKANAKQARYHARKMQDPVMLLAHSMKTNIRRGFRLKNFSKNHSAGKILGCSWEEFKLYIEAQFPENMNWENRSQWQLDHKIPISSAKTVEELVKLNHYTNFKPLWTIDNLRKSNKLDYVVNY